MSIMNLTFITLDNLIREFYDYMGMSTKPGKERVELWYQVLKNIKESDIYDAFEYMKANLDGLPRNIPKSIKNAVWQIGRDKEVPKPEFGAYGHCADCNSTGVFKLRLMNPQGKWYEPIQFCSQCDNYKLWVNDPGMRISASELNAVGTRFKPYNVALLNSTDYEGLGDWKKFTSLAGVVSDGMDVNLAKKVLRERGEK